MVGTRKARPLHPIVRQIPRQVSGLHSRQLAVQFGDDLADSLGGTSGGGNDVVVDGTSTTPVLAGGTIDGLLGRSGGVDGAHETLDNAELVVDNLGQGSEAVGGARRVRDLDRSESGTYT